MFWGSGHGGMHGGMAGPGQGYALATAISLGDPETAVFVNPGPYDARDIHPDL